MVVLSSFWGSAQSVLARKYHVQNINYETYKIQLTDAVLRRTLLASFLAISSLDRTSLTLVTNVERVRDASSIKPLIKLLDVNKITIAKFWAMDWKRGTAAMLNSS
ncbi:hypothetical protein VNO80_26019 [Phaseolus coccineus]|uniref:Uncharacterized protein n=1 Tax=Phaseolus coccineus TaxID=3886 RepID=A0AAN9M0E3_PHACN